MSENIKTAWLGDFPSHWQVKRIKNIFNELDSRSETGNEELLSVSQYTGITPTRESLENEADHITSAASLKGYKKVSQNDLVINIMLAWNGSLGISPVDGIVSPAYCVYRCKPENNPHYFGYLFSTNLFKAEFRRNSTGIIDSRLRLYTDKFFSIFSIVPPREEQDEIVELIRERAKKINRFIKLKQRFIDLLKEQRQSIITNAITKGIDKNADLDESGIDWLGQKPHHWKLRRLKYAVTLNKTEINLEEQSENLFRIALENIDGWTGKFIETGNPEFNGKGNHFKVGDVLFNKLRPYLAKAFVADREGLCVGELLVLTPIQAILRAEFLFHRLMSKDFIEVINSSTYGAKMPRAHWAFIGNLKLGLPSLDEQDRIINYIHDETKTVDIAISKAQREIELMQEYKEAMIAETVTGR
ncbi:MAG TPA: restriction endonuclease subunit S [Chitinophagales bacterium]|nr:restriction endonuclease subunit S [Chitinophagales bacterium]